MILEQEHILILAFVTTSLFIRKQRLLAFRVAT